MNKLLSPRVIALLGVLSFAAGIGATFAATRAPSSSDCCYPGSPCCTPGAPCCQGRHRAS